MKCSNTFILRGAWIFALLLLIQYRSFAKIESSEDLPDAIKCFLDNYGAGFPKVKMSLSESNIKNGYLWLYNLNMYNFFKTESELRNMEKKINSIKIKSSEEFALWRDASSKKSADLYLKIWATETSIDANKLISFINAENTDKPPLRYFVHENIVIVLSVHAVMYYKRLKEGVDEALRSCFICDTTAIKDKWIFYFDKEGCRNVDDDETRRNWLKNEIR